MSTLEKVQLLEERIKKAILLIEKLKTENASLKDEVELLQMHNEELKSYTSDYSKNSKLIEDGIISALSQLEKLEESAAAEQQPAEDLPPEEDFSFEADEDSEQDDQNSYTAPEEEEDKDEPLY